MPKGATISPETDARWRARIETTKIINRLYEHVSGKIDLTATQVRAAEILLRKVIPDLSTNHIEGHVEHSFVEILRVIAERRGGDALWPVRGISEKPASLRNGDAAGEA